MKGKSKSQRVYKVTAHSREFQFSRGFFAFIYGNSIREAWKNFKSFYPMFHWRFDSIKSETGFYTKVN